MDLSSTDKVTVLLHALTHQLNEIQRREGREQQLFEWSTGFLVAAFGALVALSDRATPLPYALPIKILATLLIAVPSSILAVRILGYSKRSVQNAETVERIEVLLRMFEAGYYGSESPYPPSWQGAFASGRRRRRTAFYYTGILLLMVFCVVMTVWLLL